MDIPDKTLKSGFSLPVFGLGTYGFGAEQARERDDIEAVQAAIERGVRHIDTAEAYSGGDCERLIAKALEGTPRDRVLLASKVLPGNMGYDDLLKSCAASLERLRTDYLDLYLLHLYPIPGIAIAETMRAMDRLVSEGMVKNIGVCNMTPNRFAEAQKHTANQLVCNQVEYSLSVREAEGYGIVEYCQNNDVLLNSWGPLQKGLLGQTSIVDEMAEKYGKTAYQVALNWLISQPSVVTIPKARSVDHLDENLGALGWSLESEDIERLRTEYPDQLMISERVPLDYDTDVAP